MQQYNQGFGCFGPMEKCDQGKWVKYEDAEKVINEYLITKEEYFSAWMKSIEDISQRHFEVACLGVLSALGWGIIIGALVRYAIKGYIL